MRPGISAWFQRVLSATRRPGRCGYRLRIWTGAILLPLSAAHGFASPTEPTAHHTTDKRPNILLILADDLGYSDIGAFGSEIHTPNLDALAAQGRLLTSLYATSMPISRAEVMTGADHHLVGVGSLEPAIGRQVGKKAYQRQLSSDALCVSEILRNAGYHTYMVGTWHLGKAPELGPRAQGFEESFALLQAAGMYFPPRLDKPLPAGAEVWPTYREGAVEVAAPQTYITDYFTDKLIGYIDRHRADGAPFFAYASYTSPHFPLQAPERLIRRYRGHYDAGYDAIRLGRVARQQRLGLLAPDFIAPPPLPSTSTYPSWEQLPPQRKRVEARRMEIYAAMIENLDANVGRLLQYLRRTGQPENTLVVFTSGNGAAQGLGGYSEALDLDKMGGPDSWLFYAERWAEVSDTPYRLWKGKPTEGGISVPGIVRLPGGGAKQHAPVKALATLKDLPVTFLDFAGIAPPGAEYAGRAVVPMSGLSLRALLEGRATSVHASDEVIADEESGEAYVRQGHWKALRMTDTAINLIEPGDAVGHVYTAALKRGDEATAAKIEAEHPATWSLYDIEADRAEQHDLSQRNPDVLRHLQALYEQYRLSVGVVDW